MQLTKKEQSEVNEYKKKNPTMYNLLQATIKKIKDNENHITSLDKRNDVMDDEISNLKEEVSRLRKYEPI